MYLLALLVIEIYIYHVNGYSQGAGGDACSTLIPGHNASAQQSPSPFSLTVNQTTYGPNEMIDVTVSGGYTGLLLQARKAGGSDTTAMGTFSSPPAGMQLKTCGTAGSSITHTSKNGKSEMVVTWNSPATSAGPIEFIATFVEGKPTFWVGVKSGILDPEAGYPTEPPTTAGTTLSTEVTTQENSGTTGNSTGTQGGSGIASGLSFGYVTLLMTLVVMSL